MRTGVDEGETLSLRDNVQPAVSRGLVRDEGPVHKSYRMPRMSLQFSMTVAQADDLKQLLSAQQNRRSPQYHQFLTPEQYAARFGPKAEDLALTVGWLEKSGFTDVQVARGGMWVNFSGNAGQAESAFHVPIHNYSLNGETHFANATDPRLPKALANLVRSVGGLHNFAMKPSSKRIHPRFTSGGLNFLAPDDWATIYDVHPLYGAGLDGSGVTIAVIGQSDVVLTDLQTFRSAAALPAKAPTVLVPPGSVDPGIQNQQGDEVESDLDLEWVGAIAKNANILFVTASATRGNGIFDSIAYVVDNNAAPIMTISYGGCEADSPAGFIASEEVVFQQANAEGITVLVASGDAGATACEQFVTEQAATHGLAVDYPASSEYVTAVGGTGLDEVYGPYWGSSNNGYGGSALSYIPEQVWNNGFQEAGGGGASSLLPKPVWQTGPGVPADDARDVPDVAFAASASHDPYLICSSGWCTNGFFNSSNNLDVVGGTSAATPSFAGLMALIVQKGGGNRFGNINPNLYSLAQISPNAFHDVTVGTNDQSCQPGTPDCPGSENIGYNAGPGYDQASGLGSVDGFNLAQQWFGDFSISSNPASLTIQPGSSATATVSVLPQNNFGGEVTVSCSVAGSLIDVTCSVPSGSISAGGSTTVTITAASTAKTPWWKRRSFPPVRRNWMLLLLAIFLVTATFYRARQHRSVYQASFYAFASVSLVSIAFSAVSCGGAGSASTVSSSPAGPLALTCNLQNATYGAAYSGSCSASGGTAPYTYSLASSVLPTGLSLNASTGAISGTPVSLGSYMLTVSVTDSEKPSTNAQTNATFSVVSATLILSCQLPSAVTGVAYVGGCAGSGGTTPFYYSISSGYLPAGLALNSSTGTISGTPLNAVSTSFVVSVRDSGDPNEQFASYTESNFVVAAGPLALSCNLPASVTGNYYSGACSTTGGSPPVAFSISAGVLPSGLTINFTGQISGDPMVSGTSSFTVRAADSGSPQQVAQLNQNIITTTGSLVLLCPLFSASFHQPFYPSGCHADGGNLPYTYSISSGTLPAGLTLNSSTGLVTGIPAAAGTSSVTFKITDGSTPAQTATVTRSFVVQPVLPLTITCLAQTLTGPLAVQFDGICPASGGNYPYTASVISGTLPPGLSVSTYPIVYTNTTLVQLAGIPTMMGTSTVTVQVTDGSVPALTATAQATITIGPRLQETGLVTITAVSGGITNTTTISVVVP